MLLTKPRRTMGLCFLAAEGILAEDTPAVGILAAEGSLAEDILAVGTPEEDILQDLHTTISSHQTQRKTTPCQTNKTQLSQASQTR
jgi:hypothetical protein